MFDGKKHSQIFRKLGIVIPILMTGILISGCSRGFVTSGKEDISAGPVSVSSLDSPVNGLVQSNGEGEVAIDVKWMGLDSGQLVFAVALNTHSVDLDPYHLGELSVLRDSESREYHPTSWNSAPGGHHRRGTLSFSPPEKAEYLELVIRGIAEVEKRVFRWEFH